MVVMYQLIKISGIGAFGGISISIRLLKNVRNF